MLILSLDTATRSGSCAVLRDDRVLRESTGDGVHDPGERLPGDLAALLDEAGIPLSAVDAFAVTTGPGSFTGLRVGIATMQGLGMALQKPLFGVSAFDALAFCARRQGARATRVAAWIDAWRGEVFASLFDDGSDGDTPVVARPELLLERLQGGGPVLFTGDGAGLYESEIRARMGGSVSFTAPIAPPLAGAVATLAAKAFRTGSRPPPHAIRPIYVRRSDAELAAERRERGQAPGPERHG